MTYWISSVSSVSELWHFYWLNLSRCKIFVAFQSAKEFTLITHFDFDGCYVDGMLSLENQLIRPKNQWHINILLAKQYWTNIVCISYVLYFSWLILAWNGPPKVGILHFDNISKNYIAVIIPIFRMSSQCFFSICVSLEMHPL